MASQPPRGPSQSSPPSSARGRRDTFDALLERTFAEAKHDFAAAEFVAGQWVRRTWGEVDEASAVVAGALETFSLPPGSRVAVFAETSLDWVVIEFGILRAGCVLVPIYSTSGPDEVSHILKDSGAAALFVGKTGMLRGVDLSAALERELKLVVVLSGDVDHTVARGQVISDFAFRACARRPNSKLLRRGAHGEDDIAMLVYTSGTTGRSKGVMLSHRSILSTARALCEPSQGLMDVADHPLHFLPLAHVFAQMLVAMWVVNRPCMSFSRGIEHLLEDMSARSPTVFATVPRVLEKVYQKVVGEGSAAPGLKGWLFRMAVRCLESLADKRPRPALAWWIARRVVFPKIRARLSARLGGRVHHVACGGAPLAPNVRGLFEECGVQIFEGYGLTETVGCCVINNGAERPIGSVGRPIAGMELKIDADGEVLIRGTSVMAGYWNRPEETSAVLSSDGWFRSGDIGRVDEVGRLYITDRKKDLIVTSGGKKVAPQAVEMALKSCALVSQAFVVGDGRKFITALLTVNADSAIALVRQRGVVVADGAAFHKNPVVLEAIAEAVRAYNERAGSFERVRRYAVLAEDFTVEQGNMTVTMKLRRRAIEDQHRAALEAMYAEGDVATERVPSVFTMAEA